MFKGMVEKGRLWTLGIKPRTYHGLLLGVVLRDGDVVVGYFGLPPCGHLLSVPQDVVQVREVVVQVDALHAVAAEGPARQLRALQRPQTRGQRGSGFRTTQGAGQEVHREGLTLCEVLEIWIWGFKREGL